MSKRHLKPPSFSPRVSLVLENISAVREIYKICGGGELLKELNRFVKDLSDYLVEVVPDLNQWRTPEIEENCVFFNPGGAWRVRKDDSAAIMVSLASVKDSDPYDGDAFVGLYVPEKWPRLNAFTALLKPQRPPGFIHIHDEDREDPWVELPLWTYVPYARFSRGGSFSTREFVAETARHVKTLVAMRPRIERMLEQAKKRN
jgi:hypothetical protein